MQKDSLNIIKDWQDRLQFVVVVALFFSSFLSNFYTPDKISEYTNVSLSWGVIIGVFFITYISIELMKIFQIDVCEGWISNCVSCLLLFEVATFLPALSVSLMSAVTNPFLISIYKVIFTGSVLCMMCVPVIILGLIILNYVMYKRNKN
jgi:hypothetical protein